VVFEVSAEKVRTIHDMARSATARWAQHEIIGQKPTPEFTGPDADTISFSMRFDVSFGVNPKQEMDKLLIMCRSGQAETLIIGEPLGVYKWVITSVRQNWLKTDGRGYPIVGVADVTMQEYAR
jgi:hypothetical protein